jgi:ribose transport system permease protein
MSSLSVTSAARPRTSRHLGRRLVSTPGVPILGFLVLLVVVLSLASDEFLTSSNWFVILNQCVFTLIIAVGMTVVLIAGGIDLSVGSVIGLTGGVAANALSHDTPMVVAFLLALAAGTAVGVVNGLLITRLRVPDFVATLAMLGIVRGALYVWTQAVPFRDYMTETYYKVAGLDRLFGQVTIPMVVAVVLTVVVAFVLRRTRFGRHAIGAGSNPEASRLSGIHVDRVKVAVYGLSGLLAGVTGILLAGRLTTVHPEMGTNYELNAIAAAVMGGAALTGGRGSILGAFAGALTLTVIQNGINILDVDPYWETIITGVVILGAVIATRSAAIAGRPSALARPGAEPPAPQEATT